jgi:hypothetical protein
MESEEMIYTFGASMQSQAHRLLSAIIQRKSELHLPYVGHRVEKIKRDPIEFKVIFSCPISSKDLSGLLH